MLKRHLGEAEFKIEETYETPIEHHHTMAPHATIAVWEADDKLIALQRIADRQRRAGFGGFDVWFEAGKCTRYHTAHRRRFRLKRRRVGTRNYCGDGGENGQTPRKIGFDQTDDV